MTETTELKIWPEKTLDACANEGGTNFSGELVMYYSSTKLEQKNSQSLAGAILWFNGMCCKQETQITSRAQSSSWASKEIDFWSFEVVICKYKVLLQIHFPTTRNRERRNFSFTKRWLKAKFYFAFFGNFPKSLRNLRSAKQWFEPCLSMHNLGLSQLFLVCQ